MARCKGWRGGRATHRVSNGSDATLSARRGWKPPLCVERIADGEPAGDAARPPPRPPESSAATEAWPRDAASSMAVWPVASRMPGSCMPPDSVVVARGSTRASSSADAAPAWPAYAASCMGWRPRKLTSRSGCPARISARTTSVAPHAAAMCSAVRPSLSRWEDSDAEGTPAPMTSIATRQWRASQATSNAWLLSAFFAPPDRCVKPVVDENPTGKEVRPRS
mmetsp:Transcript_51430/g.142401  ORF Transcript_51430/g.142401 Transcript_51430/m.142401 type:complete len:222 (+) Transcript_51430:443-1108(+)